jgi:hypothetical protein
MQRQRNRIAAWRNAFRACTIKMPRTMRGFDLAEAENVEINTSLSPGAEGVVSAHPQHLVVEAGIDVRGDDSERREGEGPARNESTSM